MLIAIAIAEKIFQIRNSPVPRFTTDFKEILGNPIESLMNPWNSWGSQDWSGNMGTLLWSQKLNYPPGILGLGKPVSSKMDEFSENFWTAFDPPAPLSGKMLRFFSEIHDDSTEFATKFFGLEMTPPPSHFKFFSGNLWPKAQFLMQKNCNNFF